MADKPILFSGPMVRAILADEKTNTRRLYKLPRGMVWYDQLGGEQQGWYCSEDHENNGWWHVEEQRPPVAVGDVLWVREAHHISHTNAVMYRADYFECDPFSADDCGEDCSMVGERWRPSIHMPRWASRITLKVTGVHIEKLQHMTRGDAMAEGCPFPNMAKGPNPLDWFRELWDGINGKGSWASNPWVWVYEFKRESQP